MSYENLKERTMVFTLRVLEVVDTLPNSSKGRSIANQLCRSGTSVAANYRAASRAESPADFIHKMGRDEVLFWLELICRSEMLPTARLEPLMKETDEILSIVISSIKTTKRNRS